MISYPHGFVKRQQIRQILIGLFENAKEACDPVGDMSLLIESDHLEDDCQSRDMKSGGYLKLLMKDAGCGMKKETLEKIFEPFFSTKFIGRGLGLSAIHGITKNHGGHISVESEIGEGSQFTVWLPSAP